MSKCCGENAPIFVVQGGRFNEGGKHNACHSCIGQVIEWVWTHPRVTANSPSGVMVEVRPLGKSS